MGKEKLGAGWGWGFGIDPLRLWTHHIAEGGAENRDVGGHGGAPQEERRPRPRVIHEWRRWGIRIKRRREHWEVRRYPHLIRVGMWRRSSPFHIRASESCKNIRVVPSRTGREGVSTTAGARSESTTRL